MITVTLVLTLMIGGHEQRVEVSIWDHADMATLERCDAIAQDLGLHAVCYATFEARED